MRKTRRLEGTVTRWDDAKGFGFIDQEGRPRSIFVHIKAFGRRGRRPKDGDRVTFEVAEDPQGRLRAEKVRFRGGGVRRLILGSGKESRMPVFFTALFGGALVALVWLGRLTWPVVWMYGAMSLVAFLAYGWDKLAAKRGAWRTPEANLLVLGLACGWPGALAAQRLLRHKSSKREFLRPFWLTVVLNVAVLGYVVWTGDISTLDRFLQESWEQVRSWSG